MSTVLDLLNAPAFTDGRLTEAINVNRPRDQLTGRPAQLGIFADRPIATTYANIGIRDGDLAIIPTRERGGPSNKNMRGGAGTLPVRIPHFPLDDAITPSDLQNLTAYGEQAVLQTLATVVNDKLEDMRSKHDLTHAHADWAALNGLYVDAESKVVINYYSAFGITQTSRSFALGTATTDVAAKTRTLRTDVKKQLKGGAMNGLRIFASPGWFDAYVGHATVKDAYRYYAPGQGQANPNRDALDDGFGYAGAVIEVVEDEFTVRLADGTFEVRPAVAANEAIAVPMGTNFGRRYVAPPDSINTANVARPGDKVFVSTYDLPHGKGRDIHTESNVLPIFLRPQAIIRLTL